MKQLTQMDSVFVYNESASAPFHISPILIYDPSTAADGIVRFKDILDRFKQRIHKSPVFRRKLVKVPFNLDSPYWIEDKNFDLEFHVRHLALPKPGDWRQFCILLSRLHSRQLDLNRPPWEAYVIEGLDNINGLPPGSFALYLKIHHCAIDGATGNQIIEALHDLEPTPPREKYEDDWCGEDEPNQLVLLQKAYLKLLKSPRQVANIVKHAIRSREEGQKGHQGKPFENHEVKDRIRFNEQLSPHRVFGGLRMDLQDLKFIKNTVGECTLNDVLLSIVGGAMRKYLLDKRELPKASLVAGVPISTRTDDQANADGGNEVSGMRLYLRTDIADPVKRLQLIHHDAVASKAYANAIGVERMSTIINSIPSGLASVGMRVMSATGIASRAPFVHTIVTNVPGPQFPMYLCGARAMLWLGAGCPMHGVGLFHTVNSYYGSVFLTFLSCRQMLPDPDFYHQCINKSFQELLAAARELAERPPQVVEAKAPPRKPAARTAAAKGKAAKTGKGNGGGAAPRKAPTRKTAKPPTSGDKAKPSGAGATTN